MGKAQLLMKLDLRNSASRMRYKEVKLKPCY